MASMAETPCEALGVLEFWFADATDSPDAALARVELWFRRSAAFDEAVRARLGTLAAQAIDGDLEGWKATPSGRLALLILLDQCPRQLARGTPAAFAQDSRALAICREGLEAGVDRELTVSQRVFYYLPLEHAENRDMQRLAVRCYEQLRETAGPEWEKYLGESVRAASEHRDTVERFGRFPHRNHVLGRVSTAAEEAYLRDSTKPFEQLTSTQA